MNGEENSKAHSEERKAKREVPRCTVSVEARTQEALYQDAKIGEENMRTQTKRDIED